MFATKVIKVPH